MPTLLALNQLLEPAPWIPSVSRWKNGTVTLLQVLVGHGLVTSQVEQSVKSFLAVNQTFQASGPPKPAPKAHRFPFEQRASLAQCDLGRKLFELMADKKTNLAVAADVPTAAEMLKLADQVGWPAFFGSFCRPLSRLGTKFWLDFGRCILQNRHKVPFACNGGP